MKKHLLISLILFGVLLVFFLGNFVYAADVSSCGVISTPGIHTLTTDLVSTNGLTCINITSDDVIFDLAGFSISNASFNNVTAGFSSHASVYIFSSTNVTVKNGEVSNSSIGVYFKDSSNITVTNMTLYNNGNAITIGNYGGIFIDIWSSGNNISKNNFTLNRAGITDRGVASSVFNESYIEENNFLGSSSFFSLDTDLSTIKNNNISITAGGFTSFASFEGDLNIFEENTITSAGVKSFFFTGNNNSFSFNNLSNLSIFEFYGDFNNFTQNVIFLGGRAGLNPGFYLEGSSNRIEYNNLSNNRELGLEIASGTSNTVRNNTFEFNEQYAISVASNNNLFLNNTIKGANWTTNSGTGNAFNDSTSGNAYYFSNGSGAWTIFDISDDNSDGWADSGDDLPFNATTLGTSLWTGNGEDWHPFVLSIPDSISPKWTSNSTNSTLGGTFILHSINWTDETALSGYIFSFDNGTGTFSNDSFVIFSGTQNWSNVTKYVNATVGSTIQWYVWANDSSGNVNSTSVFSYLTTQEDGPEEESATSGGSYIPKKYPVTEEDFKKGYSKKLFRGDIIVFNVSNVTYNLTLDSFNSTNAKVKIKPPKKSLPPQANGSTNETNVTIGNVTDPDQNVTLPPQANETNATINASEGPPPVDPDENETNIESNENETIVTLDVGVETNVDVNGGGSKDITLIYEGRELNQAVIYIREIPPNLLIAGEGELIGEPDIVGREPDNWVLYLILGLIIFAIFFIMFKKSTFPKKPDNPIKKQLEEFKK